MPGLKVKKGDRVRVIAGKDRGKEGRVVRVWPDESRVLVEGVNVAKRHEPLRVGRGRAGTEGGIVSKEMPLPISNVMVICGSCGAPTRVGYQVDDEGDKRRVCRKCGGTV